MRIRLGKAPAKSVPHRARRSYLDTAEEILGLPLYELKLASVSAGAATTPAWPEECQKDSIPEFMGRIYALASQI